MPIIALLYLMTSIQVPSINMRPMRKGRTNRSESRKLNYILNDASYQPDGNKKDWDRQQITEGD